MKHIIESVAGRIVEADSLGDEIKKILLNYYVDAFYNKRTNTWDCYVANSPLEGRQIRIDSKPSELIAATNEIRIKCKRNLERNGFMTRDTGLYFTTRNGYSNLVVKYYIET